jgi:hypothetical protein
MKRQHGVEREVVGSLLGRHSHGGARSRVRSLGGPMLKRGREKKGGGGPTRHTSRWKRKGAGPVWRACSSKAWRGPAVTRARTRRPVRSGERGGTCGPRVENVGRLGKEGTGPAREKLCRIFNK